MRAKIPGAVEPTVTALDYAVLFESPSGQAVLDDLVQRFTGKTYVQGGHDAERETCFRAGKREVVEHILRQINSANGASTTEEE